MLRYMVSAASRVFGAIRLLIVVRDAWNLDPLVPRLAEAVGELATLCVVLRTSSLLVEGLMLNLAKV